MGARVPTDGMKRMYEEKKNTTLKTLESCIDEMIEWDEEVTKKKLMERTGLSSGTLSKPYVIELLKTKGVCQFKKTTKTTNASARQLEKNLSKSVKELEVLRHSLSDAQTRIITLKDRIDQKDEEISSLKETLAHLRGQQQLLLERLENARIGVGNIIINK